jgi:glutamate-1-semialdehyde 2,1-aminomutase
MNSPALETVAARGLELQAAITEVLERSRLPFVIFGHPSMFSFWFAEQAPKEYRDWLASDKSLYNKVVAGLIRRGIMPEPDCREPWFICAALSVQDIAETAGALEDSMCEALQRW